jgi:hypothetical protein
MEVVAQSGDIDSNGDIVDQALLERLSRALCTDSPIDLGEHLACIAGEVVRAVRAAA